MKYPKSEKQGLVNIGNYKCLIYSKGYGCMAQRILSVPIRPPREFVKCCVPTVGHLSFKVVHAGGEFVIYAFILFYNFYFKKSTTFKKCISRTLKIDVVSQDILFICYRLLPNVN